MPDRAAGISGRKGRGDEGHSVRRSCPCGTAGGGRAEGRLATPDAHRAAAVSWWAARIAGLLAYRFHIRRAGDGIIPVDRVDPIGGDRAAAIAGVERRGDEAEGYEDEEDHDAEDRVTRGAAQPTRLPRRLRTHVLSHLRRRYKSKEDEAVRGEEALTAIGGKRLRQSFLKVGI